MANHTSPIDVIILASDGYYAMVRAAPSIPREAFALGRSLCCCTLEPVLFCLGGGRCSEA